ATGSSAFVPPLAGLYGSDAERSSPISNPRRPMKQGAFVFRTLDDCEGIAKYAEKSNRAAVIGGGLLGLEAAPGLRSRGLETHVVHLMGHLMEVQLDEQAGEVLRRSMEEMGVRVYLERKTTAILGNGQVTGLQFDDGSELDCEMVVISAGIRPNTQLAK